MITHSHQPRFGTTVERRHKTRLAPLSYAAVLERARLAEHEGRTDRARALYEVALSRLHESALKGQAALLLCWIAESHASNGDMELMRDCAETALEVATAHSHQRAADHARRLLALAGGAQSAGADADPTRRKFLALTRHWGRSIESNDEYTQGHSERVADIACALAAADGMDAYSLFWFRIGALLHDVGKLIVPVHVLNKPGRLDAAEWALVRSHPLAGSAMLASIEFPWDVTPIVEGHHERWDGAGYPRGLAGEDIPRTARIVCIADVYDALTSERSYKRALSHDAALDVMRADAGRQFDPALFALFEWVAREQGSEWSRAPETIHLANTVNVSFAVAS